MDIVSKSPRTKSTSISTPVPDDAVVMEISSFGKNPTPLVSILTPSTYPSLIVLTDIFADVPLPPDSVRTSLTAKSLPPVVMDIPLDKSITPSSVESTTASIFVVEEFVDNDRTSPTTLFSPPSEIFKTVAKFSDAK